MGKYLDYLLAVEHFLDEAVNLAEVALLSEEIAAGEACKFFVTTVVTITITIVSMVSGIFNMTIETKRSQQ